MNRALDEQTYPTVLGSSDRDSITLLGQDLATDLMGSVGITELTYRMITLRRPTAGQVAVLDAVLIALADHGFTPMALSARLTLLSAPDALQGAVAAGLLGGGSRFLGVTEDCGQFLAAALAVLDKVPDDDAGWDAVAVEVVTRQRAAGKFVPGLGHHVHKDGDPRTPRLIEIATKAECHGPHLSLFEAIGRTHEQILGKHLPLNGAGVCGAALADIGIPLELLRGVALLARCAGLLGQLAEELRTPIARALFERVEASTVRID